MRDVLNRLRSTFSGQDNSARARTLERDLQFHVVGPCFDGAIKGCNTIVERKGL